MPEDKPTTTEDRIKEVKKTRKHLDILLQGIKTRNDPSRENALTITKIQEAIMWQGMELKRLGAPNPYPESKNPENADVEPTADGLTM